MSCPMRRLASAFLLAAFTVVLISTPARAQVCAGFPSLRDRPFQVGGGAAFTEDVTSFGASFTGGKRFFGTLNVGTTSIEVLNGSSVDLNVGAGYEVGLSQGTVAICPLAGVAVGLGPNNINGTDVDVATRSLTLGVSVGTIAARSPQFAFIPAIFLQLASATTTVYNNVAGTVPWPAVRAASGVSESETFGVVGVGLGFVLERVLTIQPAVAFPFGSSASNPAFGITVAVNLGRPAPEAR